MPESLIGTPLTVTPTSSAGKPRTVKAPSFRPVTSLVAEIAPGMLLSIWVKLAPGEAFRIASRPMVDTALDADWYCMLPPPIDSTWAPLTCTASSCWTRLVALELVVLDVVVTLSRTWEAAVPSFCDCA